MYTSATNNTKQIIQGYLLATLCTVLFSTMYEQFAHEVYSPFMIFAFLIPLMGCAIYGFLHKLAIHPTPFSLTLFHFGLAFFTFGSLFMGALEIYGTTNALIVFYPIIGSILVFLSIAAEILFRIRQAKISE